MFGAEDVNQNELSQYMTPKSERRERNRQLHSLSDTENRTRKHRLVKINCNIFFM